MSSNFLDLVFCLLGVPLAGVLVGYLSEPYRKHLALREWLQVPLILLAGKAHRRRLSFIVSMRASAERERVQAAYRASAVPTVRVDRRTVGSVLGGPRPGLPASSFRVAPEDALGAALEAVNATVRTACGIPPHALGGDLSRQEELERFAQRFPHTASCLGLDRGRRR